MKRWIIIIVCIIGLLGAAAVGGYIYLKPSNPYNVATIGDLPLPFGYKRIEAQQGSFAEWLRALPLRGRGTKVYLYNSENEAKYQWLSTAVVDIPLLSNDEQCADVCMHLRAEYLYSKGLYSKIRFTALNGNVLTYDGGSNRKAFHRYLRNVFGRCNTNSLCNSMKPRNLADMQIGDVFVYPHHKVAGKNRYGHAMIVADMAEHRLTGEKIFLLVEGNTPARDIHVLRNFKPHQNPWFHLDEDATTLQLNAFRFNSTDLKHF